MSASVRECHATLFDLVGLSGRGQLAPACGNAWSCRAGMSSSVISPLARWSRLLVPREAVVGALRGEGVKGAKLNQVGPASGFAHYSILIGAEHGGVDEIDDFVNRLRPYL